MREESGRELRMRGGSEMEEERERMWEKEMVKERARQGGVGKERGMKRGCARDWERERVGEREREGGM